MPATAPRDYPASSDHIAQTSTTGASQHRTAAAGPDRPTLAFAPTSLIKIGDRIRVVGEVRNTSALPACLGLEASAFIGDTNAAQQRMGTLGAHRLHPSETRPDSIEFEGVLRLQDANISAGYNPEFFRLPEFEDVPDRVTLRAISQYCDLNQTLAPTLSDIRIVQDTDGTARLTASVEKHVYNNRECRQNNTYLLSCVRIRKTRHTALDRNQPDIRRKLD
jgi:hypothetical protein